MRKLQRALGTQAPGKVTAAPQKDSMLLFHQLGDDSSSKPADPGSCLASVSSVAALPQAVVALVHMETGCRLQLPHSLANQPQASFTQIHLNFAWNELTMQITSVPCSGKLREKERVPAANAQKYFC